MLIVPSRARRGNRVLEFPDILRRFCRAAGIETFSLLGQSLGASYALRCAQVNIHKRRYCKGNDGGINWASKAGVSLRLYVCNFIAVALRLVRLRYFHRTDRQTCRGCWFRGCSCALRALVFVLHIPVGMASQQGLRCALSLLAFRRLRASPYSTNLLLFRYARQVLLASTAHGS